VLVGRVSFLRRQDADSKKSPSRKLTWMSIFGRPHQHHTPTRALHDRRSAQDGSWLARRRRRPGLKLI
jgi:hypothetical protein